MKDNSKPQPPSDTKKPNETKTGKERMNMNAAIIETKEVMEETAKITSKGQLTFPAKLMKELNLKTGDQLRFILREDGQIHVEPVRLYTADQLFGMFDQPEDEGNFVLDLDAAREERAEVILSNNNYTTGGE